MPVGTSTPNSEFTFAFAKVSLDGDTSSTAKGKMPAITAVTVTFDGTEVHGEDGAFVDPGTDGVKTAA